MEAGEMTRADFGAPWPVKTVPMASHPVEDSKRRWQGWYYVLTDWAPLLSVIGHLSTSPRLMAIRAALPFDCFENGHEHSRHC